MNTFYDVGFYRLFFLKNQACFVDVYSRLRFFNRVLHPGEISITLDTENRVRAKTIYSADVMLIINDRCHDQYKSLMIIKQLLNIINSHTRARPYQ